MRIVNRARGNSSGIAKRMDHRAMVDLGLLAIALKLLDRAGDQRRNVNSLVRHSFIRLEFPERLLHRISELNTVVREDDILAFELHVTKGLEPETQRIVTSNIRHGVQELVQNADIAMLTDMSKNAASSDMHISLQALAALMQGQDRGVNRLEARQERDLDRSGLRSASGGSFGLLGHRSVSEESARQRPSYGQHGLG